mgnify:CR=1 FL=1
MKISKRLLNFAYVWRKLQQQWFQYRNPDAPWLTEQAVILLSTWLRESDIGIEWGSGRSTLWFASRVSKISSVESDLTWYEKVQGQLERSGLTEKVDYRDVPVGIKDSEPPRKNPYSDVADEFHDGSLDFALIDGKVRLACVERVMPKLKSGGLLILDNAERYVPNRVMGKHSTVINGMASPRDAHWDATLTQLDSWRAILSSNGIWDTRFWIKPETR